MKENESANRRKDMKERISQEEIRNLAKKGTKYATALAMIILIIAPMACGMAAAYDKTVHPGQWVNLTGPTPPSGVTYTYQWNVQTPQGGSEVTLRNATSSNVQKSLKDLKFYAPYYGTTTVLYVSLLVAAQKAGGDPLAGCSENAAQKTIEIVPIEDGDLSGDSGDHCTSTSSTYTFTTSQPGLEYAWYLGPVNTNPATDALTGFTAGVTPASVTPTTSTITIDWVTLNPSLKDSGNQPVPPSSGTFTVSLQIKEAGTVKQTISKTVNLVPKPTPGISVE